MPGTRMSPCWGICQTYSSIRRSSRPASRSFMTHLPIVRGWWSDSDVEEDGRLPAALVLAHGEVVIGRRLHGEPGLVAPLVDGLALGARRHVAARETLDREPAQDDAVGLDAIEQLVEPGDEQRVGRSGRSFSDHRE